MSKKPVILCVLDGWGYRKEKQDNADIIAFLTKFVRIMTKNKKTVNIKKNKEK